MCMDVSTSLEFKKDAKSICLTQSPRQCVIDRKVLHLLHQLRVEEPQSMVHGVIGMFVGEGVRSRNGMYGVEPRMPEDE